MKPIRHQKGFVLLLVIALIPLFGMAATVLTANSRQILTQTRRSALKTQAQLACESGIAWLEANGRNVTYDQPITLTIDHEKMTVKCHLEVISQTDGQTTFAVTGSAEDNRFSCQHSMKYIVK